MVSPRFFRTAVCSVLFLLPLAPARAGQVELVSRRDPGAIAPEILGDASSPALSADGRWVAFTSTALNLVPGQNDANNASDVFLLDRLSGTTTLVSHSALSAVTTGTEASDSPSISADGRFVAFRSLAVNLVPGQTYPFILFQLYVYDRDTGVVSLVSHKAGAAATPGNNNSSGARVSRDGGSVVFMSQATDLVSGIVDTNGVYDVFVYDVAAGTVALISHTAASTTTTGSALSWLPWVSADGRFILFDSQAVDLVSGQTDTASTQDVFLHDRTAGTTVLVSRAAGSSTTAANGTSVSRGLSDDGAYAVFSSTATNLVPGQADTPFTDDVFLFERSTGAVTLVSHANGAPATAVGGTASIGGITISGDGAWVVFSSPATNVVPGQTDANGGGDVFLLQIATGATTLVSHAAGSATTTGAGTSFPYGLSDDGQYVLLGSFATDLVSGQTDTNGVQDAFLHDRVAGTTALVTHVQGSSTSASATAPETAALSADGSWAAFVSASSNLTAEPDPGNRDLFLYERASGANLSFTYGQPLLRRTPSGFSGIDHRGVSQDGRYVAEVSRGTDLVAGQVDTNDKNEVFLADRVTGTLTLVSHAAGAPATASNGFSTNPAVDADGSWLAFDSDGTDLASGLGTTSPFTSNVFLYNRDSGALTLVSRQAADPGLSGNGPSVSPVISADGRYVAFASMARNLVTGQVDTTNTGDVFLYDRVTGGMALVSHQAGDPVHATNGSLSLAQRLGMTPDGRWVLFPSRGTNLVSGQTDTNAGDDLFLYDRTTGTVTLVSRSASSPTTTGNAPTAQQGIPAISPDGRYVAFLSPATDLIAGQIDTNGQDDVFLFDRLSGTVTLISHQDGSPATAGNGRSIVPLFSEDGLYLTFASASSDLVPGQSAGRSSPFLYEIATGTLSLLPEGSAPQTSGSTLPLGASAGARIVLLQSSAVDFIPGQVDRNAGAADLFLVDRTTGARTLVSQIPTSPLATGNNSVSFALLRSGGNRVYFYSLASDLVPGDFNRSSDVFAFTAGAAPASDYYTVTPCRALDTRSASPLPSGAAGHVTLHGVCGVPATAVAVAVNVTAIGATGPGYLKVYPGDVYPPPTASTMNFQAGVTRANNAMLPLAYDGSGTLGLFASVAGGGTVHVVVDVVGYFQ